MFKHEPTKDTYFINFSWLLVYNVGILKSKCQFEREDDAKF